MTVAARGDKADFAAIAPDRLVARSVRVERVDFQRRELMRGRRAVAFGESRRPADEFALVPGDPAVHARHPGRIGLGELRRPDAEALFEPEREKGVIAVFAKAEVPARVDQRAPQRPVLERAAVDLIAELADHRNARDPRPNQSDVEDRSGHEGHGGVRDVLMGDALDERARLGPGNREADHVVGDVAHHHAGAGMIGEPAHVPGAQIVGAFDPVCPVAPVDDRQVALELAALRQHRRKFRPSWLGKPGDGHPIEPALGLRSGDLVARERRDIEKTRAFAHRAAFGPDEAEGVGAFQRRLLLEAGRSEVKRSLESP